MKPKKPLSIVQETRAERGLGQHSDLALDTALLAALQQRYLVSETALLPRDAGVIFLVVAEALHADGYRPNFTELALAIDRLIQRRALRCVIIGYEPHVMLASSNHGSNVVEGIGTRNIAAEIQAEMMSAPPGAEAATLPVVAPPPALPNVHPPRSAGAILPSQGTALTAPLAPSHIERVEPSPLAIQSGSLLQLPGATSPDPFTQAVREDMETERVVLYRVAIVVLILIGLALSRSIALTLLGKV